jgi:periplasmic protein TonB
MVGHLFRDVVEPSIKVGDRRGYTVPLSIAVHALLISAAIIVPLVVTDSSVLPVPSAMFAFVTAAALPLPPAAPLPRLAAASKPPAVANPNAAPAEPPPDIAPERPSQATGEPFRGLENTTGLVPGGGVESLAASPPPPPPPARPADTPAPVRLNSGVQGPTKIKDVLPVYPRIAQAARVQGVVIIEATIGPTGAVQDARILRSIPLLDAAALEAVRQWEYTPTRLNGQPVAVLMTITVNFTLR